MAFEQPSDEYRNHYATCWASVGISLISTVNCHCDVWEITEARSGGSARVTQRTDGRTYLTLDVEVGAALEQEVDERGVPSDASDHQRRLRGHIMQSHIRVIARRRL